MTLPYSPRKPRRGRQWWIWKSRRNGEVYPWRVCLRTSDVRLEYLMINSFRSWEDAWAHVNRRVRSR